VHPDVRFLAGRDWAKLRRREQREPQVPILNLIQHVRHTEPEDPRYPFLTRRAIRICVSAPVADAVRGVHAELGIEAGPVLTIPAAIDLAALPAPPGPEARPVDLLVVATKRPDQGELVHNHLARPGRTTRLLATRVPREELLTALTEARVTVFLPNPTEGFYLPSLEGMALGTLVVCPDCVGNREHCQPSENCFRPAYDLDEIVEQAEVALELHTNVADDMRAAALATAQTHDLPEERRAFHAVLDQLDELWARSR
jgi:glycosyltransferase involved in cell wall biosynthesis